MPAPLRSWTEEATAPDGRRWAVVVSVPHVDSAVDPARAVHHVAVRPASGRRRPVRTEQRVVGEAAADALVTALLDAIAGGWQPGSER